MVVVPTAQFQRSPVQRVYPRRGPGHSWNATTSKEVSRSRTPRPPRLCHTLHLAPPVWQHDLGVDSVRRCDSSLLCNDDAVRYGALAPRSSTATAPFGAVQIGTAATASHRCLPGGRHVPPPSAWLPSPLLMLLLPPPPPPPCLPVAPLL